MTFKNIKTREKILFFFKFHAIFPFRFRFQVNLQFRFQKRLIRFLNNLKINGFCRLLTDFKMEGPSKLR